MTPPKSPKPIAPFELDPKTPGTAKIELVEPAPSSPVAVIEQASPAPPRRRPWWRLLLGAGAALLIALLGLEAYDLLVDLFARSIALGGAFTLLIGLAAGGALGLVGRELLSLRRLARIEDLRHQSEPLLGSEVYGRIDPLLTRIEQLYRNRAELQTPIEQFHTQASDALDDGERLQLFARTVLAPLDRKAEDVVKAGARDIGVLTALSPLGLLDSLIVLARTLTMVRRLATLYGIRPGGATTVTLLRRAIRNVLVAGIGELASDAAVEAVGASLLSVLSAKAGQGMVNGLLAAKLGLSAMQLCRPLPFKEDELPSLKRLRVELFE